MSELRFYNQLHQRKEVFRPIDAAGPVRVYSCGPTVYSRQHLGNMRSYFFADLLRRTLEDAGHAVKHVINITDVGHLTNEACDSGEDKMEAAARAGGESVWDVARRYTELFQRDLGRLNVRPPALWTRATDHIAEQIEMIRTLEAKGFTYRIGDGIYFDVSRFPSYGELIGPGGSDLAAQCAQERIEAAGEKRNPADFALWKLSPSQGPGRQMEWPSPWGVGFPGWHIECSAMSAKHLGVPFDIHTGGADHIPVHHTNEIAQSESAFGVRPCVNFWMHNGWVLLDGAKISKSAGHTLNVDDLIEAGHPPLAYRYFLLGAHYRQQMSFSRDALAGAEAALRRLWRHAQALREAPESSLGGRAAEFAERFRAALADDLNTPQALAVLWEAVRSEDLEPGQKRALLVRWDELLALDLLKERDFGVHSDLGAVIQGVQLGDSLAASVRFSPEKVQALIRDREQARSVRDFKRADAIRDELKDAGVVLEDRPDGTTVPRRA